MTPASSFNNETPAASNVIRHLLLLKLHNGNSQPRVPIMKPILPVCVFVCLFSPLCRLSGQACLSSVGCQPESRPKQGSISCPFVLMYKYIRILVSVIITHFQTNWIRAVLFFFFYQIRGVVEKWHYDVRKLTHRSCKSVTNFQWKVCHVLISITHNLISYSFLCAHIQCAAFY